MLTFTPARRTKSHARVALDGPSGSGKTWTALTIATGLTGHDGRIAVIDTEHGSASKYATNTTTTSPGAWAFDSCELTSFSPTTLIESLAVAADAAYDVVVIDSLSHFWAGADGMLEQVDRSQRTGTDRHGMSGWKAMAPTERAMIEAMLAYPGHIIVTLRVKSDWVEETGRNGKRQMIKVGTRPVQRDGIEFEFDIVASMDADNTMTVTKSRCPAMSGKVIQHPTDAVGVDLAQWLSDGTDAPTATDLHTKALAATSVTDLRQLYADATRHQLLGASVLTGDGSATTLGDLIRILGARARTNETQENQ